MPSCATLHRPLTEASAAHWTAPGDFGEARQNQHRAAAVLPPLSAREARSFIRTSEPGAETSDLSAKHEAASLNLETMERQVRSVRW